MREILFRGKRTDNGEWVEGFYIVIGNPFTKDGLPMRHCIAVDKTCFYYEVDPATVGQFTGLCDKNGNKIFEGDIVTRYKENFLVIFDDAIYSACFGLFGKDRYGERTFFSFDFSEPSIALAVIGNIHDNPELMEAENNEK